MSETVAAVEALVGGAQDADEILRETVVLLAGRYGRAALTFFDDGDPVEGPAAGSPTGTERTFSIVFDGLRVGELTLSEPIPDPETVEKTCSLIAAHVLLGWDTGGVAWDP